MRGEFQLNDVHYKGLRLPHQTLANQMASKVGQGTSEYGDLTNWSAWIQENWQDGVGRLRPQKQGGMLYSEAESRVPEQIIMPGRVELVDTFDTAVGSLTGCRYTPTAMTGMYTVTAGSGNTKAAINFTTPSALNNTRIMVWVYLSAPYGTELNFEVRNNSSGSPGSTVHTSDTVTVLETNGSYYWHGVELAYSGTLATSTTYWLTVFPTAGTIVVGNSSESYNGTTKLLVSGVWTTQTGHNMMYMVGAHALRSGVGDNTGSGFFRFYSDQDKLYCYTGARIHEYATDTDNWTFVVDAGNDLISSTAVFDRYTYFGTGSASGVAVIGIGSANRMDETETMEDLVSAITFFRNSEGRLWYVLEGVVNYAGDWDDATTFGPGNQVGTPDHPVKSLCAMGDSMYVSTDEALYRIAPGDFVVPAYTYSGQDDDNGRCMVNFEGALYITVNNRVIRFTQDQQVQDVWMNMEDDLVSGRLGRVESLCAVAHDLFAFVAGGAEGSKPTIWAMSGNSWHHIATLPTSPLESGATLVNYSMYYDRTTSMIWLVTPQRLTWRLYVPQFAHNPYNDAAQRYHHHAWVEWDWFDGPVMEAQKDYDSITIMGENFATLRGAAVYYKQDSSTDWELLGTVDTNNETLSWAQIGGTRPNTKRFKLGMRLFTNDYTQTPRIRAIRVKYHLMVRDWFRWNLVVDVSGRSGAFQLTGDGTRHTLTADQIKSNIDTLCTLVPPFKYTDLNGSSYAVKVVDANFQYTKYEYNESTTNFWWEGQYNIVIEQTTSGVWVPS